MKTIWNLRNLLPLIFLVFILGTTSCLPDEDLLNPFDSRDALEGVWQCNESSPTFQNQIYEVAISKSLSDSNQVIINNFFGLGLWAEAKAVLSGSQLLIPQQTVENFQVEGTGNITSDQSKINLQYFVTEIVSKKKSAKTVQSETVQAVYVRK